MASAEKMMALAQKGKAEKVASFAKNKSPEVRADCATALGICQNDVAYNQLVLLLMDSDLQVKTAAAKALGEMGLGKAREQLRHAAGAESDEKFQEIVKEAIAKLPMSK